MESTAGVYVRGGVGSSVWARFFADDPVTRASLQGSRLRRSGRLYSFVHKSIPEYFAACAMWADVVAVSSAVKAASMSVSSSADVRSLAVAAVSGVLELPPGGECFSALNRIHVLDQPAVLAFMVDMLVRLPSERSDVDGGDGKGLEATVTYFDAVAGLHAVVWSSAVGRDIGTASANCGSVLAQCGVSLSGARWDGACLKGAVLSDAVLSSASLRGADLRNGRLERVIADGADLTDANLEGVSLGQYPMMVGHGGAVRGLALSPDGKVLASCGNDNALRLWDVATSECVGVLEGHGGSVIAVAFYPDGSAFVSSSNDSTLKVWSIASRTCTATIPLRLPTETLPTGWSIVSLALAVSPNGRAIAAGLRYCDLRVFDTTTHRVSVELPSR